MDNIRGKSIAITGAARGIGYASAKALLARGARVVIGDRDVALQESAVVDARGSVRYRVLLAERCGDEVVCCVEADRVFVGRFDNPKPRRDRLAQRVK